MNNFRHVSFVCITYYHPALMNKRLIEQILPVPTNVQLSSVYCTYQTSTKREHICMV